MLHRFYADLSPRRSTVISNVLGFDAGSLPFTYLGVPLFKGRPKAIYLQPIANGIKTKLSTWKGLMVSIMGRVQLVNSVINNMLIYSFHIYSWPVPVSLLKNVDKWIRNFVWAGDINTKKMVTITWKKVCLPIEEGGLGLKSIQTINRAALLKLSWDFIHSQSIG